MPLPGPPHESAANSLCQTINPLKRFALAQSLTKHYLNDTTRTHTQTHRHRQTPWTAQHSTHFSLLNKFPISFSLLYIYICWYLWLQSESLLKHIAQSTVASSMRFARRLYTCKVGAKYNKRHPSPPPLVKVKEMCLRNEIEIYQVFGMAKSSHGVRPSKFALN